MLFSLYVIWWHKLEKYKFFLSNKRKNYRVTKHSQRRIFTQHLRKNYNEFLSKTTIFYSIFNNSFIAVDYIVAQFLLRYSGIIFALKAIRLQNSKTNVYAAFAQEDSRIAPKDSNILRYL